MSFIIGLDLGQAQDYTAIAIVEMIITDESTLPEYHARHLERPSLGTSYPAIVDRVGELLTTDPLSPETPLVVDQTGVGRAVLDLFWHGGLAPIGLTITGGNVATWDGYFVHVPKRELVGTLVALLQSGRLKIAAGLAQAEDLVQELLNFKVKVNLTTGHDSYEAWRTGQHDDLVLAVAMACWCMENPPMIADDAPFEEMNELWEQARADTAFLSSWDTS